MSEEIKGQLGSSGVGYDVQVDDQLNVILGVSASVSDGTFAGSSLTMQGKIPLIAVLDAAAAATKSGTVVVAEGWLKTFLLQYEASKTK